MSLNEFNDNYLNILLQKISKEKKNVFLLGDLIDSLSYYMYLPYILHPARVTGHSQTIIENIYKTVSGNLTSTICDHLPQVLFIPSLFSDNPAAKSNILERS